MTLKTVLLCAVALLGIGGSSSLGHAQQNQDCMVVGLPCKVITVARSQRWVLDEPAAWNAEELILEDGAVVETQGHELKVKANTLIVRGKATIRSFDPGASPAPPPPTASEGTAGASFDPGPGTEGPCASCRGQDGGDGKPGADGLAGTPGRKAGVLVVEAAGLTLAPGALLTLDNRGGRGGEGGVGGGGGRGGVGGQGGRATPGDRFAGVTVGCKKGPGSGGSGGDGGEGGRGGTGGPGGDGGTVVLRLAQNNSASVQVLVDAGEGGPGGRPGSGGVGAKGGFGGRGATGCDGREGDRSGPDGVDGRPRTDEERGAMTGRRGRPGQPGQEVRL